MTISFRRHFKVADAHKEQKILVGLPSDEVVRICPEAHSRDAQHIQYSEDIVLEQDGRVPFAGAVLRLGGAHLGGYGESDIAYAYRQVRPWHTLVIGITLCMQMGIP